MHRWVDVATRFEAQYIPEPNSGCWLWTGSLSGGYGTIVVEGRPTKAHRLSYVMHRGPITPGLLACHRCDNRLCVNPDHLFLGTHVDNMADMIRKGRVRGPFGKIHA